MSNIIFDAICNKVSIECNSLPHVDDNDISHCHIVSKHDVRKAISNLKSEKMINRVHFFQFFYVWYKFVTLSFIYIIYINDKPWLCTSRIFTFFNDTIA